MFVLKKPDYLEEYQSYVQVLSLKANYDGFLGHLGFLRLLGLKEQ